jgi:hypothetical protein
MFAEASVKRLRNGRAMGGAAWWERLKPILGVDATAPAQTMAAWLTSLKAQIAQVAMAKSLQQFGREEEKP